MSSTSHQQDWYASKMKCPMLSQVDSFSPALPDFPSFLYPLDDSTSSNMNYHHPQPQPQPQPHPHMSRSHSIGTYSYSTNNVQEVENNNVQEVEKEINHHHPHMSLSQSIGTYSYSTNFQEVEKYDVQEVEKEENQTVLEKRQSHNARERDRRRKINALYSSLGALLPPSGKKGKLSIPRTISKVLKYIPEQRKEIQRLSRMKEELLIRVSRKKVTLDHHQQHMKSKATMDSMSQHISANWLSDTEIALQIATSKSISIYDMLLQLEEKKINVTSISSSVSSTSRIFYTMHLEKREDCKVRLEELNSMVCLSY